MATNCSIIYKDGKIDRVLAPNGADSLLFKSILDFEADKEKALRLWGQAYTPKFKRWYGNWELVAKAKALSNNVKGLYALSFNDNIEQSLFEAAIQAKSSESELDGAIRVFGQEIVDIALELFPDTKVGDVFIPTVSTSLDENGEPLVTTTNNGPVFIQTLNENQEKSIFNNGSFLIEDNNTTLDIRTRDSELFNVEIFDNTISVGGLSAINDGTYLTIEAIAIEKTGDNIGTNAYLKMAQFAIDNGLQLRSDVISTRMSQAAIATWNRFLNTGQAEIQDDHYIFTGSTKAVTDDIFYNMSPNQVNYNLKLVNALQKTPRKKYPSNSIEGFYNDLIKLGTPKNQLDILKQHIASNNITEINTDDLITSLLAEISYTVEVNTTKDSTNQISETTTSFYIGDNDYYEGPYDGKYFYKNIKANINTEISEEEFNLAKSKVPYRNSSHYSNMTVPGGTNYTENEIATPQIVPSIKGHAQFATENGIGWFRSDDAVTNGKWYQGGVFEGEMIASSTEGGTLTKTRRILEVQSDLFQKGRKFERLDSHVGTGFGNSINILSENGKYYTIMGINKTGNKYGELIYVVYDTEKYKEGTEKGRLKKDEVPEDIQRKISKNAPTNQFLQLLNKDNNWVTFFIKSIIQDSVKKGYEKVLFPSGNTANKVEGQQTLEAFIKTKQDRIDVINSSIELLKKRDKPWTILDENQEYTDIVFDTEKEANDFVNKSENNDYRYMMTDQASIYRKIESHKKELEQLEKEIKDIKEGRNKFSAINSFYENTITNVLKKQGFNPLRITDEYGNGWNEITITPEIAKKVDTILMNLKVQGRFESIPEVALNTLSKNGFVNKFNPDETVFEDRWYFNQSRGLENSQRYYNHYMSMNNLNRDMFKEGISSNGIPYLIPNKNFNLKDTIEENNERIHKDKYEAIIDFFVNKFGIPRNKINYITKKEFAEKFPDKYRENAQSVYYRGNFYFFTNNQTADITVEELLHPFIFTVKELNKPLFDNLLKEAQKNYPLLHQKIQVLYKDQPQSIRDQELVTQAMARVFNNVYENEEPQSFIDIIKDWVKWLTIHLNEIFKQFHTGKVINLGVTDLHPQTSMEQIAQLLNATDTKFDVIFPEGTFYNMKHNPTDFQSVITTLLTDKRVEANVEKMLRKLPEALEIYKSRLTSSINKKEKEDLYKVIKDMEKLEDQDKQNLVKSQLKGIITTVQIFNKFEEELGVIKRDENMSDSEKIAYYISIYHSADGLSAFKQIMLDLRQELTDNLRISTEDKNISKFQYLLDKALGIESIIKNNILGLLKTPAVNILSENNKDVDEIIEKTNKEIKELEDKIQATTSLPERNKLHNKLASLLEYRKDVLAKAPTKENLQKVVDGIFGDASQVSFMLESMIANGHPLVNTLQDMINDIYDRAGGDMVNSKNEMSTYLNEYLKAKNLSLRDMNKVYEDIGDDIVKLPTGIKYKEESDTELDLDENGNIQFNYVEQYALYQRVDNDYIRQYRELEMIKDYYYQLKSDDIDNNVEDSPNIQKYKDALSKFEEFIEKYSEREYSDIFYKFRAMLDEKVGDKTVRQITGDIYNRIEELEDDRDRADSSNRESALLALKAKNIELKKLKSEYNDDLSKKDANGLRVAQILNEYTRLRYLYGNNRLTEDGESKYNFDLKALEYKKSQYTDEQYKDNLSKIQQTVISPDYFEALTSITDNINALSNVLIDASENSEISKYLPKDDSKEKRKDIYKEIRDLVKPYRDEDQVIDGIMLSAQNPDLVKRIKELQQYIEDIKFNSVKMTSLSPNETNEHKELKKNKDRTEEEQKRYDELADKREALKRFKAANIETINQLNSLFKELGELSETTNTEYYSDMLDQQMALLKKDEEVIDIAVKYLEGKDKVNIDTIYVKEGGKWYEQTILDKKNKNIFIGDHNDPASTGHQEMLNKIIDYIAKERLKESEWWKDNHYIQYVYSKKTGTFEPTQRAIYIWEHQTPNNPNFIEIKPAKEYHKYEVKDSFIDENGRKVKLINDNYSLIYKNIPAPKQGEFVNKKYFDIIKDPVKAKFLHYLSNKYLEVQEIYEDKFKMGHIRPAVIKTEGENTVNLTNKALSFDGTFTEIFKSNVGETDTDTAYLIGGSQSNTRSIPIRFVGKMDKKQQTMNVVGSILLFEYHASLYKALNDKLPVFEAAQLLAAKVEVTEKKNYIDKLGFFGAFRKMFYPSKNREEQTQKKETEKSNLSKSVDHIVNTFVFGQRVKPAIIETSLGNVDLAKVSQGILGFAAKWIFAGNIISALYNSLATRLQAIINSGIKSNLYTLTNLKNGQAKATKYTKDLLSDWTKLGNKSLIGQVLDYFSFLAENPGREITDKSEFYLTKNKTDLLTSPKQISEFEVLFVQFLTIADATTVKVNGKETKLSNIEEVFEIKDGKFQTKKGAEFTKQQEKIFRGKFQGMARKLAGAYRTTEVSSIETHWLGKSAFFLRRYFISMARNRFVGKSWNKQEQDIQIGYHRETFNNLVKMFQDWKNFGLNHWSKMSDKQRVAAYKTTMEYGMLFLLIGLLGLAGGDDDKKTLKKNSWAYNLMLVTLFRAKTEMEQFTLKGVDDLIRTGKNPFMIFTTMSNVTKTIGLVYPTIMGDEKAYYKQSTDAYLPILGNIHEKGDPKLLTSFLKIFGATGASFVPHEYLINFKNAQNR